MRLNKSVFAFLTTFCFVCASSVYAQNAGDDIKKKRALYKTAREHLTKGRWRTYLNHKQQLRAYPLLAYLEYEEIISDKQAQGSIRKLKRFIENYPRFPHLPKVQTFLVEALYVNQNWEDIIRYTDQQFMPCLHLAATSRVNQDNSKLRELALVLWDGGDELDDRCVGILRSTGFDFYANPELVWRRIQAVIAKGKRRNKWQVVSSLRGYLDASRRATLDIWLKIRRNTRQIDASFAKLGNLPHHCELMTYALIHYPQEHAAEGYKRYKKYARKCRFSLQQQTDIVYHLGLKLVLNDEKAGLKVMFSLNPRLMNEQQHEWRARSAIKFADWRKLLTIIGDFPPALANEAAWLFWHGYALTKLGRRGTEYYERAAQQRDFYGFYAAEKTKLRKKIDNKPADITAGKDILQSASFLRFVELRALGEEHGAQIEWRNMLSYASKAQRLSLAGFAYEQQDYYLTLRSFAAASYWDDLQRRYPMPYRPLVEAAGRANNLNPALIYAIIRTESAYQANARSGAGAVGLMQVLPSTARATARRYQYRRTLTLTNPSVSIDIGSLYLRQLFERYQDNVVLVLASYNAGPGAVNSWLPERGSQPAIEWLETIPYGETRKYVRSVLFARIIFGWRMGRGDFSFNRFMRDVEFRYN